MVLGSTLFTNWEMKAWTCFISGWLVSIRQNAKFKNREPNFEVCITEFFHKFQLFRNCRVTQVLVFGGAAGFSFFPCKMFVNSKWKTTLLVFTVGNKRSLPVVRKCTDQTTQTALPVQNFRVLTRLTLKPQIYECFTIRKRITQIKMQRFNMHSERTEHLKRNRLSVICLWMKAEKQSHCVSFITASPCHGFTVGFYN